MMEIVSKEDLENLSNYSGLSALDCLAIVAQKAYEKEGFSSSSSSSNNNNSPKRSVLDSTPSPMPRLILKIKTKKKTPLPFDLNERPISSEVIKKPRTTASKRLRVIADHEAAALLPGQPSEMMISPIPRLDLNLSELQEKMPQR